MNKRIAIMGCGWLGTPLAQALQKEGHSIKGSTTNAKKLKVLDQKGIPSFVVSLNEKTVVGDITRFLEEVSVLVINVPPGLRKNPDGSFVDKMNTLLPFLEAAKIPHVLFVSSTSVYGNLNGDITEESPTKPTTNSGIQLLEVERLLQANPKFKTTILRFGGLIGEDRHPITQLSGRQLQNGGELINLIHQRDCIHMIKTIIEYGYWGETFNGVYPDHPTKQAYYTSEAAKRGIQPPVYSEPAVPYPQKRIIFRNFYVKNHVLKVPVFS